MSSKYMIVLGLLMAPTVAHAAEEKEQSDPPLKWSVGVDGGISAGGGQGTQPSVAVTITRNFGEHYVRLSLSQLSADPSARNQILVPATTRQISLAGGLAFGDFTLEGHASFGDRAFRARDIRRPNSQLISISSSGSIAGGGASLTYDLALNDSLFLSPSVAIDYTRITTARVINLTGAAAPTLLNQSQSGVTASAGVALQKLFGPRSRHAVAINGAVVTTSNNASVNRSNVVGAAASGINILQGTGLSDTWGEIGGVASFGLTRQVSFTVNAVRTVGLSFGNITSVTGGFRLAF